MKIQVKLLATYREYLPTGITGNTHNTKTEKGATAVSVLTQYGVPTDGSSVVLVNGRTPNPDQRLQEGDVVCAFPAIAGG
ncbi:MAG: MoaD/ThiS family protein [Anaerolineae bacterium]